jgi:integrase
MHLDHIRKPVIKEFISDRQLSGVSLATIDRSLALLKSVLNLACDDEMIDKVPSIKLFKPDNQITRFITKAEAAKLISKSPDWLADLIIMSLSTGLRESDLLELEWRRVDLKRRHAWIERQTTKGVKSIPIPMNDEAWLIVLKYANQHPQYVFTKDGEKIQKAGGNEWKKALNRAKIDKFRWHDLRHTWASWHVQAGTPLRDLMDLGGWSNMQMVLRYAHLRNDDLERHKDNSLIFGDSSVKTTTPPSTSSAISIEPLSVDNSSVVKNNNVVPLFPLLRGQGNQDRRTSAF